MLKLGGNNLCLQGDYYVVGDFKEAITIIIHINLTVILKGLAFITGGWEGEQGLSLKSKSDREKQASYDITSIWNLKE